METLPVELAEEELQTLDAQFPRSLASAVIGRRAEAIVRIYFRRMDPNCEFHRPRNGADLEVTFSDGRDPLLLEIKGTDRSKLSWQQLKVSSQHSWRHLVEHNVPIYRVTAVFGKAPCITELRHERDFTLEPEARWSFKAKRDDRAPPSRIERPAESDSHHRASSKKASKYAALGSYLSRLEAKTVTLTFAEMEKVLGFALPSSAVKHQAFWANQTDTRIRPWSRAWQQAGYRVDGIHLHPEDGWVRFSRV